MDLELNLYLYLIVFNENIWFFCKSILVFFIWNLLMKLGKLVFRLLLSSWERWWGVICKCLVILGSLRFGFLNNFFWVIKFFNWVSIGFVFFFVILVVVYFGVDVFGFFFCLNISKRINRYSIKEKDRVLSI